MRVPMLAAKFLESAVLTGLAFVAIQALPAQAAVPDRAAHGQTTTFADRRDGSQFDGGYQFDGRYDQGRGAQCFGGGYQGRDWGRQMNCSSNSRSEYRFPAQHRQDRQTPGWGYDQRRPQGGYR
jgi:hypothetical protein